MTNRLVLLRVLCVLCGYSFGTATVIGAAPQEAVLVERESFAGELISVGADGDVTIRGGTPDRMVATAASPSLEAKFELRELVRWGHPVSARGRAMAVLADGGRLVAAADWAGGAPVRLEGEKIVVLSDLFGEVPLERGFVRGFVFAQLRHAEEREELAERVRKETSPAPVRSGSPQTVRLGSTQASLEGKESSDVLFLSNGDRVSGKLVALERGSLTIETSGSEAKLPLSRVDAVRLGNSRQPPAVGPQSRYAVGLRDGSLVYADEVVANEKVFKIKIGDTTMLDGGNVGDVVFLQSLGGRVVYLSDLEAVEYRHVPYLKIGWPLAPDRNVLGGPLGVDGKRYLKGLGMHSAGRASYRLDGKYKRFEAAVAIDDAAEGRGSVTFAVYVLRDGTLSEAYKSGIVRGAETPQPVSVDVAGAQGITLVVDYAERGDEMDRADWLDARFIGR